MAIFTRDLSRLPDVNRLRALLQSMAMLDAVLSPEWEFRYYSFNACWSVGEQMGSMRNGSGDEFFAWFNAVGCILKGFAHEAPMSPYRQQVQQVWPGVLDAVPAEFAGLLTQPAFSPDDTTFCIWRRYSDQSWQHGVIAFPAGRDLDGSEFLLSALDGEPTSYQSWAEEYYERPVSLAAVRQVYDHTPLTEELARQLNPEISQADLAADIAEIGYP